MNRPRYRAIALGTAYLVGGALAVGAQAIPDVRPIGPVIARTIDSIGAIEAIRVLTDGRVVLADPGLHRVLIYDSTLTHATLVTDSLGPVPFYAGGSTGTRAQIFAKRLSTCGDCMSSSPAATLLPYLADTTLFYDQERGFIVIDPQGRIARITPAPRGVDATTLLQYKGKTDARGRVIFQTEPARTGLSVGPLSVDTAPLLRESLTAGRVDTVAFIKVQPQIRVPPASFPAAADLGALAAAPFIVEDDWTLLPDATLAIVRAPAFFIDLIAETGARTSTPELPATRHRLTDSDRTALADTMRRDRRSSYPIVPEDFPDYRPIFLTGGSTRTDAAGNLWIKLYQAPQDDAARPTYMVVDRSGRVLDRVQLPANTTLMGFGPGVALLRWREGRNLVLGKARIR